MKKTESFDSVYVQVVRTMRVERTRVAPLPPEDSVSAISPRPHVISQWKSLCLDILAFAHSLCKHFFKIVYV